MTTTWNHIIQLISVLKYFTHCNEATKQPEKEKWDNNNNNNGK